MFENLFSEGGLSLDRLRTLCAVDEAKGITRAAGGDPAKQSLYSRQIRELEAFFGTELTRRKGKGIELTTAGKKLAREARSQLVALQDFRAAARTEPTELRLAAGISILEWVLLPHIKELRAAAPGARFQLLTARTRDILDGLRDHTIDLAIVRKTAVSSPLRFVPHTSLRYAVFAPASWVRSAGRWEALAAKHPFALTMGGEFRAEFDKAFRKEKSALPISFECSSFTQAAELVRSGQAFSILPTIAGCPLSHAKVKELPFPPLARYRRELGIAYHPRQIEVRPALSSVLETLTANCST